MKNTRDYIHYDAAAAADDDDTYVACGQSDE
jgi:hypothetical protein